MYKAIDCDSLTQISFRAIFDLSNDFISVLYYLVNWLWSEIRHICACTFKNSGDMTEFSEKRDPKKSYSDPNGMNFEFIFGLQNHTSAGHALAQNSNF